MTVDHACSHWVRNCVLCLLSSMLRMEQYYPKAWNTETIGDLYLVDSAIVIFDVHDEGTLTSYCQSCANASAFPNLLELELEILEMVLIGRHCGQTMIIHTNQERVRIKANSMKIIVGCVG